MTEQKIHPSQHVQVGDVFGEWHVIAAAFPQTRKIDGATEWLVPCQCSCGSYRPVRITQLRNGRSKSCGWCAGDLAQYQRLYTIWRGMLMRCYRANHQHYNIYGGRGIKVCLEWKSDFKAFRDWSINNRYGDGLTLDRIDNDGNYEPANCQWITNLKNQSNKSDTVRITAFGETKSMMEWCRDDRCQVAYTTLRDRLRKGMLPEEAIILPKLDGNIRRWGNKKVTAFGETKTMTEWQNDSRCSVTRAAISLRLSRGWSEQQAISEPAQTSWWLHRTRDITD